MADEAMGTPEGSAQVVNDLDSAIDKAFEELSPGGDGHEEESGEPRGDGRDPKSGRFQKRPETGADDAGKPDDKDPAGKDAPGKDPASDPKAGKTDPTKEAGAEGPTEPPKHWSDAQKEMFRKQSPEAQAFLLERHKSMEGEFTKKTMAIAEERKGFDAVKSFVQPIWPTLTAIETEGQKRGFTVQQGLHSLWTTYEALHKDPTGTIAALAKQYGADLSKLTAGARPSPDDGDPAYEDPQLAAAKKEIADLRKTVDELSGTVKGRTEAENEAHRSAVAADIASLVDAKGDDGQPLYPHFEEVRGEMAALIGMLPKGAEIRLSDLYAEACMRVPAVRKSIIDKQTQDAVSNAEAKRKADAEAAEKKRRETLERARKGSSATFRSLTPPSGGQKARTLDDALELAVNELAGR